MESRYNAETPPVHLLELPERVEKRPMPEVELIDMRNEFLETRRQSTFSRRLVEAITERLQNREQIMLLLNRRGFSSFVACRSCGERIECQNCAVTLTHHRRDRRMLCHYCNYAETDPDRSVPSASPTTSTFSGWGRRRWRRNSTARFRKPGSREWIAIRSRANGTTNRSSSDFRGAEYDILVGTQMIAKGHDIPNVTLVGVVSADVGLGMPDFRAAERTFQLLTQAAGRAGRGERPRDRS